MKVFETAGLQNTEETCRLALKHAIEFNMDIVSATTEGTSAFKLLELAKELNYGGKIVIVTHAYGSQVPGENILKMENREALISQGAVLVTAAHILSGVERGMSTKFSGIYPAEIMAHALRMVSRGVKVAVEIGCMALDAGEIAHGKPIVCMGGSGRGLDSAVVMNPAHANHIFETKIHEILCMPY